MKIDQLQQIRERLRQFTLERDWAQFHDPKNLAMAIVSEAGELAAELRWIPGEKSDEYVRSPATRERIAHEVADVAITLLLFCERAELDLLEAVEAKMALNAARYPADEARGRAERQRAGPESQVRSP